MPDSIRVAPKAETPSPQPAAAKTCGCTGVRWCARCRASEFRAQHRLDDPVPIPEFLRRRPEPSVSGHFGEPGLHLFDADCQSVPSLPDFRGLRIYPDFLSEPEARDLLGEIERTPFQVSQSGKHKQHYGAKVNFNKQRVNAKSFRGIPAYARDLEDRLRARVRGDRGLSGQERAALEDALRRYRTTDVFVLRYWPIESSNLDFHLDDLFSYGELILDVSLESDSVLTFLRGRPNGEVEQDPSVDPALACVRVPLPARSVAVLYGPARLHWEHAILDYDVVARRTSITLRTLSEGLRDTKEGREVLSRAGVTLA